MSAEFGVLDEDAQTADNRVVTASEGYFKLAEKETVLAAAGVWSLRAPAPNGAVTLDAGLANLAALVRDVVGNPFRPATIDRRWLTAAVVSTARAIYDRRAFDQMTELAEDLEWAGCTDADVLEHCRGPGPHVLGCWVVDLILRKK